MGEEQKPLAGQAVSRVPPVEAPVEAPEEDEWEDLEPVLGSYGRAVRAVEDYTEAEGEPVGEDGFDEGCVDDGPRLWPDVFIKGQRVDLPVGARFSVIPGLAGLSDDIAACRDAQARSGEVSLLPEEVALDAYMAALGDLAPDNGGAARLFSPAVARGSAMHVGFERLLRRETGTVARLSEPEVHPTAEVYPPTGYTGLTADQAAALRGAWEGAHLQRNGGEGFVESEDGHVFKLSDAANAHMKRVGAVYTACRWAAGQEQPFSVHTGGQPRDWTPGARFRFTPAPLGEAGEEVGVTLICVVPGSDIHRAQVVFRPDNAPAPRALLIGLWKLTTRPEGA